MRHGNPSKVAVDLPQPADASVLTIQDEGGGFAAEQVVRVHVHRWRIAEPEGATSIGNCLVCGDVRLFTNVPTEKCLQMAEWGWSRHGGSEMRN